MPVIVYVIMIVTGSLLVTAAQACFIIWLPYNITLWQAFLLAWLIDVLFVGGLGLVNARK